MKLRKKLGEFALRVTGWKVEGEKPALKQAVLISAPHTSNWDLFYGLAVGWSLEMEIRWVGKHTLFALPLWGAFMRALGGVPVDRRQKNRAVSAIAGLFSDQQPLWLIVPPEGTRGKSDRWKSGFYWIAHEAKVPVVMAFLDYSRKVGGAWKILETTGDLEKDFQKVQEYYGPIRGKFPAKQGEVRL